jgi:hypothetical protein
MRRHGLIPRTAVILILLTALAIIVHGYHLGIEDQDVYLAAIKKNLHPELYPVNAEFFTEQMKASAFIPVIAWSIRLTHVSIPAALFAWHALSIFLILLGCWQISSLCFEDERARWAGVMLVAVLLTIPIAGTALYVVDQYLHPRALATAALLFSFVACMRRKWIVMAVWLAIAGAMHPLMALFGASLLFFASVSRSSVRPIVEKATAAALILPLSFGSPSQAWREAALSRTYYFPLHWAWYEWLGMVAPVLLMYWFSRIARKRGLAMLEHISTRLVYFALFQFAVGAVMTMPPQTLQLAAFQPMRWLHLFYIFFLLFAGALIGQSLLRGARWRWLILFLPVSVGMFAAQRDLFPASGQIDLPSASFRNPWAQAFVWIRDNTPVDAVFAIDPNYMELPGEDAYGFRGLAERSLLAENQKDPGAATVFPALAPLWQRQVHAQLGIEHFSREQFEHLRNAYGATWAVLPGSINPPLNCPYRNEAVQVCSID